MSLSTQAKGVSTILQHIQKEKQLYLLLSADAYGIDFYQNLSSDLQRRKLSINRTLWVAGEKTAENKLQEELEEIAQDIENNIVSGATFILGFLDPNDFRLKSLADKARKVLGKHLGNVLWIFPVVHLDFTNVHTFHGISQALAFRQSNSGALHCNEHDRNCSLSLVLKKLHDRTDVFEYRVEKVGKGQTYNR